MKPTNDSDEGVPGEYGSHRLRRLAATEVNGRRVNEAIERGTGEQEARFVCECGHHGCGATIPLAKSDYEAVRADFDRFLVAPGHEMLEVDEVVERHAGYLVVAKRDSEPREIARRTDPRAR